MTRRDGPEWANPPTTPEPAPPPGATPLDQAFEEHSLYALRAAVAAIGALLGLSADRLDGLVVAANELATNAIRYGGGSGRLRLWRAGDDLCCQVSDHGPGIPDPETAGTRPVPLSSESGRGLWIVRQFCDQVHIATSPAGTTVTVTLNNAGA
jgi:anti-sigma regulatory factor (Ser/Thr protein kinase)